MSEPLPAIESYRCLAATAAERSHVPYSGEPNAVILVTNEGRWIPGVRVESATFSLTIPALLNAITTAVALKVQPIRAVIATRPFLPHELTFARRVPLLKDLSKTTPFALGHPPAGPPGERASPFVTHRDAGMRPPEAISRSMNTDAPLSAGTLAPTEALAAARSIAARAFVPESDFPVGALLEIEAEGFLPGVNVEHENWMHVLCAERNALGTAISYGYRHISAVYLTCVRAPGCTPCGACRQLLAELAPTSTLWMVGDNNSPASSDPVTLLPGFFAGNRLLRDT